MNDEMTVKMFNKCIPDIVKLDRGETIDEKQIWDICDFIDSRFDCVDFRMTTILRILNAYSDKLSGGATDRMKRSVLSFKYWMDEPGEDSICYWSENHQIIFHSCEYLAGQLYPDDTFVNSMMTGRQHMEKARPKILNWLLYRWDYGFSEWHSNVYYEEDIAPLANLIDFCADGEIARKSVIIMDLLLLDMALHSFKGFFSAASGRCYEEQKTNPACQFTLPVTDRLGGFNNSGDYDYRGLCSHFLLMRNYEAPEVIRKIARDTREVVIKDSMGLNLHEIADEFGGIKDIDTAGMYLWGMEAFTNSESINITMDIFNKWNLKSNVFLRDLKMVNYRILRKLGLLPLLVRILNPATQGIAIQRANTYTYKTKRYMLSTAQKHHPGTFGDQQHIWQATLSRDISIFTTHPACKLFDDQARNFSPSYWVGTGRMPHSAQHENIQMSIYVVKNRKGFMERELNQFTHAWFPSERFDRVEHDGRYIFGEYSGTYAALIGRNALYFKEGSACDLIQRGVETYWICELGEEERYGSFESFMDTVRARPLSYKNKTLSYGGGKGMLRLEYKGDLTIDGKPEPTDYPRLDTPYVKAERKPGEIFIEFGGKYLRLNFNKMERTLT